MLAKLLAPSYNSAMNTRTGLQRLVANNFAQLNGAKTGVISNHSAIDENGAHLVDLLVESKKCSIARLFSPEHGFRGDAQDMESVETYQDPKTGIEVVSLYGSNESSLVPSEKFLSDLDLVVFDIQDIGSRYYTYVNTLAYTMGVAAKTNTKVLVLDRPNPINGISIEGSPLEDRYKSFCGYAPIGNRHGLTSGELSVLFNKGLSLGQGNASATACELEVVELENWDRSSFFNETSLPWVLPSPNMPTLETALVYPGGCLFEATNMSEARGTTRPFELIGAPYIVPEQWSELSLELYTELSGEKPEGFFLRQTSFTPGFQKWAKKACHGVQIHITDCSKPFSYRLCLAMIAAAAKLYPNDFAWRSDAYEFKTDISPIDILYGNPNFRLQLEKDPTDLKSIKQEIEGFEKDYSAVHEQFKIY